MKKNRKVIHYKKDSYFDSKKKMTPLKWVGSIALILVLAFIGWNSFEPVMNFLNDFKNKIENDEVSSEVIVESSDISEAWEEISSNSEYSSEEPIKEKVKKDRSVYIPTEYMTDFEKAFDYFKVKAEKYGDINSITIYLKDDLGQIYLPVKNDIALEKEAVMENSTKIADTMVRFKEKGISVNGIVSVFKDPKIPSLDPKFQIMYLNSGIAWIDNDPKNGGKQWLNPYSPYSIEYIINLAKEFYELGADKLIFDNIMFPAGFSLELAHYDYAEGRSRQQAISDFSEKINKSFDKDKFTFMVHGENAAYPNELVYGGNHLNAFKNNVMLVISPDKLKENFVLAGENYKGGQSIQEYMGIFKEHYPEIFSDESFSLGFYEKDVNEEDCRDILNLLIV